jgi:hypothetical protein
MKQYLENIATIIKTSNNLEAGALSSEIDMLANYTNQSIN